MALGVGEHHDGALGVLVPLPRVAPAEPQDGRDGGLEVVGEAGNGQEAVARVRQLQPDVVLMDVRMPVLDGLGATAALTRAGSSARVLILTTYDADEYLYDAMRAGACGFLLKDVRRGQLADAVRTVAGGDSLLHPALTRRLVERFGGAGPAWEA